MYRQKIGICYWGSFPVPFEEELQIIKGTGFDAISPAWREEAELGRIVDTARTLGLELQSLHAPFHRAACLWSEEESVSAPAKEEILRVIDDCVKFCIPIAVVHVWIGFDYTFEKSTLNYGVFEEIVRYAEARDIKIAFENTEGIEYLFALMEHFKDSPCVGFCWDSGHEMCYNYSEDILGALGDRLLVTHLNDNLGISRFDGTIFWTDDLHLLPYDGIADWEDNVRRLRLARHLPILNFELNVTSKPDRHENDVYARMSPTQYYTEAYQRACKIAYRYARP